MKQSRSPAAGKSSAYDGGRRWGLRSIDKGPYQTWSILKMLGYFVDGGIEQCMPSKRKFGLRYLSTLEAIGVVAHRIIPYTETFHPTSSSARTSEKIRGCCNRDNSSTQRHESRTQHKRSHANAEPEAGGIPHWALRLEIKVLSFILIYATSSTVQLVEQWGIAKLIDRTRMPVQCMYDPSALLLGSIV